MKEHLILQQLIKNILKVDIFAKTRRRDVVDARRTYANILFGRGEGVTSIGKMLRKHHATIIHYVKDNEMLLLMDVQYKINYDKIYKALDSQIYNSDLSILSKEELILELQKARDDNEKLRAKFLRTINASK